MCLPYVLENQFDCSSDLKTHLIEDIYIKGFV